jgi:hypothetical protein
MLLLCGFAAAVAVHVIWFVATLVYRNRRVLFKHRDVFV